MKQLNQSNLTSLFEALNMYMAVSRRLADKTKQAYTSDILHFIAFVKSIGVTPMLQIPLDVFEEYLSFLEKSGVSAETICRKFYALKSMYSFLCKRSLLAHNPIDGIELPKRVKTCKEVYLTEHEVAELLNSIRNFPKYQRLNAGMVIETLVFTGVRNEEMCNIKVKDVDFHLGKILIHGKGNKDRYVPINKRLFEAYNYYFNHIQLDPESPLLYGLSARPLKRQSLENIINKAVKITNIKKKATPHTLRHSLATLLPRYGALRADIRLLLGHGRNDTTDLYSHSEIEQIRRYLDYFASTINQIQDDIKDKQRPPIVSSMTNQPCLVNHQHVVERKKNVSAPDWMK